MVSRTNFVLTIALFVGIAALVLHLLAICSPHWKTTKRDLPPAMLPVSYGLWEKCEYTNMSIIKQGVALGSRPNVQFCYPNRYMRYSPEHYKICHSIRRTCSIHEKDQLPEGCSCRYLPSTKALQWLTVLAAVCLIPALLLLYLRAIAAPQNDSASFVLVYGPLICFLLTLLLLITGLILFGTFFRRDTYEDYSFPLPTIRDETDPVATFDLHSLRSYAKYKGKELSREKYVEAEQELLNDAHTHFHTVIGRATIYELIATVLILIDTGLSFWLVRLAKSDDI